MVVLYVKYLEQYFADNKCELEGKDRTRIGKNTISSFSYYTID